ncbi:hypothetical protein OQA88_4686 [Cercophora sp. LCS_1]
MGSIPVEPPKPWIETPLVYSIPLSQAAGCNIYLKLENLQPSGSFKSRGIGNMMFLAAAEHPSKDVHFFCSSEGNAGLACATTAAALNCKATIVTTKSARQTVVSRLRNLGAQVVQAGSSWPEADAHLHSVVMAQEKSPSTLAVYVSPFNHPDVWSGAATLVDELADQMRMNHREASIDAVVCSVGGGGLLNGVMEGLERHKKTIGRPGQTPKVLAVETVGADSLNASVRAGEHVTLPKITSIAGSLGATRVSDKSWEWASTRKDDLISITVTDPQAAMACVRFLEDVRILVEPACGATLATAYYGNLRRQLGKGMSDDGWRERNVVLVVCGGSNANMEALQGYKELYGSEV